nr:class I SAM-dependent methyltransferase [uncultured Actinomyces sp.]
MATHIKSTAEALPFADRPVEKAPGHWVLARAGKTVLRPGGLALSTWALKRAVLPGADVVEFAPGLGVTASAIIEVGPASYTGVERDPNACARVNAIASGVGRCVNADAAQTGLPDESADVVVGEAMLSMQGEKAKRSIMGEAARILRPGGRYVIHELGMRPDSIGEEPATEIRKALARAINVNARPLTVADWRRALEDVGLVVEETRMAPMALLKPGRMIADEGVRGALRIMRNVARDKDLRERVTTMARTFKKYDRHLCGVAIVARKPKENS